MKRISGEYLEARPSKLVDWSKIAPIAGDPMKRLDTIKYDGGFPAFLKCVARGDLA